MKLWVTGSYGALGSEVAKVAQARGHEVMATAHHHCDITDLTLVHEHARAFTPDAIINCAGARPDAKSRLDLAMVNAIGPRVLASTGVRLVHMSTDAVYSGDVVPGLTPAYPLPSDCLADPRDDYGRTKLAGEVDGACNVRGTFLTPENGFLRWLLCATGEIEGWENYRWNGGLAGDMAEALVELAEGDRVGVVHVASEMHCTKAYLAQRIAEECSLPLTVKGAAEPLVWRVLNPDVALPPLEGALRRLCAEIRAAQAVGA